MPDESSMFATGSSTCEARPTMLWEEGDMRDEGRSRGMAAISERFWAMLLSIGDRRRLRVSVSRCFVAERETDKRACEGRC